MSAPAERASYHVEAAIAEKLKRFRLNKLNTGIQPGDGKRSYVWGSPWTQRAVARRARITNARLAQYESQRATPVSLEIYDRWCRALGLKFAVLIDNIGYVPESMGRVDSEG